MAGLHGRGELLTPGIPRQVERRQAWRAFSLLAAELGRLRAAAVLAEVALGQLRDAPFAHLPAAADLRERLSRRQCAPAVLLYRALRRRLGDGPALELTRQVVVAGAIEFLSSTLGALDPAALAALPEVERAAEVRSMGERFFNAIVRWDEVSATQVRFTVTRCLFPGLCAAAGAPEVAPLLCAGDAVFFGQTLKTVELERPTTLAAGGSECPFILRASAAGRAHSASNGPE